MSQISLNTNSSAELYKSWQEKLKAEQAKKAELQTKQTELTTATNDINVKTNAQTQAETRVANTTQNVTNLMNSHNALSQQWNIANNQVANLAAQLAKSPEDSQLQAKYDSAKANLQSLEISLQESNTKLQAAKTEQEEAEKALEKAKTELLEAEALQKELESSVAELEGEVVTLGQEVQTAQQSYETAKTQEAEEAAAVENSGRLTEEEALEEGYTLIKTAEDLRNIEQNPSGKYILMNDIDLSGIDWVPLCQGIAEDGSDIFSGILNGNGYSVKNLNINVDDGTKTENVGFFGVTENATISDINFENANVQTPETYNKGSVGVIAGTARGTSFENITVSGNVSGHQKTGGLVGSVSDYSIITDDGETILYNSSFKNVTSDVNINSSYYAGGLVGYVDSTYANDMVIENCTANGNINVKEKCAGGFIGEAGSTIITINNSTSNMNISCENPDGLRLGGFVGCANGSKIAFCNSEYNGSINAEGEFKGDYYGYYMNDSHVTIFELEAGLPVDDILNIEGIDSLTPVVNQETGEATYNVNVSTLNGLDKIVALVRNNPQLAELITFNVLFDFESMDNSYNTSSYSQYGVVQHLYEETDQNGNKTTVNEVYIDNEIDLETTFHAQTFINATYTPTTTYERTLVNGLWKDSDNNYYVERNGQFIKTTLEFFFENQRTSITTRLDSDEIKYRERLTSMVYYYQLQMYAALAEQLGLPADYMPQKIEEPEYQYLKQRLENGETLTPEEYLALSVYDLDNKIINLVAETTHNQGCGMGGDASFLDETKAIPLKDEDGRIRYTTLSGIELRQRLDEEGNLLFDEYGDPVYENLDGSDYLGLEEVYVQRGYPKQDENGNMLYSDEEGRSLTQTTDEDGNQVYTYEDGTVYEGDTEKLTQQLEEYNLGEEYKNLEDQMKDMLNETKGVTESDETVSTTAAAETDTNIEQIEEEIEIEVEKEKDEEPLL